MLTVQKYVRPQSLEEAWQLNQRRSAKVIGGMLWLRLGDNTISTAIDLCDLGLNKIEENESEFSVGAMTSLRELELNDPLNTYTSGAVKNALKDIVGVQFRNMATVGGSIWGRFGFSDVLTVFLALDSYVELYKGGIIPLEQFCGMKKDNDILTRLIIKKTPGKLTYTAMRNQRTDFPVITCAVSCMAGEYRAVIGARPGRAVVIHDSEGILGSGITEDSIRKFAEYTAVSTAVSGNLRASAEYRTHLIKVLTSRMFEQLGGM